MTQVFANEGVTEPNPTDVTTVEEAADVADQRQQRYTLWKQTVEAELQQQVKNASTIREKITTAKTQYKKKYYNKKFVKVQSNVMQMVATLQRLEAQMNPVTTSPTEITNDTPATEQPTA